MRILIGSRMVCAITGAVAQALGVLGPCRPDVARELLAAAAVVQ